MRVPPWLHFSTKGFRESAKCRQFKCFQIFIPSFTASDVVCWDRVRARRCTGGGLPFALSVCDVGAQFHPGHVSRGPDNPGRPNFSPGLEPWPILHEPSQTPRGLSADSHTPHDSGLPTASFHLRRRLIPALCPDIARMTKPPSVQSPFAPRPVLPARGRRVPPPG